MDAQQLVNESQIAAAVVGKGEEFRLIPITADGPDTTAMQAAMGRGFEYCGVMGWANGQARSRCEPSMEAIGIMACASLAFAEMVAAQLKKQQAGDGTEWLQKLWELPDTRGQA